MHRHQEPSWRGRPSESSAGDGADEKVIVLPNARLHPETNEGQVALDLVYQAAEMIQRLEAGAVELEARARSAMEHAAEKLQAAERCIKVLEADRLAVEKRLHETDRRAQDAENTLQETQSRLATAEAQLYAMEMRVNTAESHALRAKQALIRVEDAIRTNLLDTRSARARSRTSAA
jgi:DNA repair exonuclease SbcCD ATPase subunit